MELVYSGDSTLQGLLDVPEIFNDYLRTHTMAVSMGMTMPVTVNVPTSIPMMPFAVEGTGLGGLTTTSTSSSSGSSSSGRSSSSSSSSSGCGGSGGNGVHPVLHSLNLDFLFTAEVLILEMTYLDGPVDKAVSRGHVHLDEFLAQGHMFSNR